MRRWPIYQRQIAGGCRGTSGRSRSRSPLQGHGEEWQDGTALFSVMRVPEFELPGWSHSAYENDILVVLTGFALTMIACDLIFLWRALDRLIGRVRSRMRPDCRAGRRG